MYTTRLTGLILIWLLLAVVSCELPDSSQQSNVADETLDLMLSTVTPTVPVIATAIPEPTPAHITLKVWAPLELSPESQDQGADVLHQQIQEFEFSHPDLSVLYEPKPEVGPANLLNYLRSASAVAPSVLPDIIILPTTDLIELAQTQLLFPLDGLIDDELRKDLYSFAIRDTTINDAWLAVPIAVQVEHGVIKIDENRITPTQLDELLTKDEDSPTQRAAWIWSFAGQARNEGEMSNALLLQLLALEQELPTPSKLPPREEFITLFSTLQAIHLAGAVPTQVLSLAESSTLYERLRSGQADLIQSNSRLYMQERDTRADITFAPLPTLEGESVTVIDGYLLALTTNDPRRQAAASLYLHWLLEPSRLAEWTSTKDHLPARQSALAINIQDSHYLAFLNGQLERGWLRPGGTTWRGFAQLVQEQFRLVMLEQSSPKEAVETIITTYAP